MTTIFGISISSESLENIKKIIELFLYSNQFQQIITVNPEMLLVARQKKTFADIIVSANLRLADGVGIVWAANMLRQEPVVRITGNDLIEQLCTIAHKNKYKVYLMGGTGNQAERSATVLANKFPGLSIRANTGGAIKQPPSLRDGIRSKNKGWIMDTFVIQDIQAFAPEILFVALGHEKQEQWIHDFASDFPSVRVAVGVGGAFAFLSGQIPRAPIWMRQIGFEWLWRLIQEPRRAGRIFKAVIVFPFLVILDRIRQYVRIL